MDKNRNLCLHNKLGGEVSEETKVLNSCCNSATEHRNYTLNKDRSLEEKKQALNRQEIEIVHTGGGVRVFLSTAVYELLKLSADKYFTTELTNRKCNRIQVEDQQGRIVETKYKVTNSKTSIYTANFYHTKSSCLVNGKQTDTFFLNDLPEIFMLMENELVNQGLSLDDVKHIFTNALYPNQTTSKSDKNGQNIENVQEIGCSVSESRAKSTNVTELPLQIETRDSECQTIESGSEEMLLMRKLYKTVDTISETLQAFIHESRQEYGKLRDEIQSIKNKVHLEYKMVQDKVVDLTQVTEKTNTNIQDALVATQRKFQSIQDLLKTIQLNGTKEQDKPIQVTKPPVIEIDCAENQQPRSPYNKQQPHDKQTVNKYKTYIIGDSILKGISTRGLNQNVSIRTLRGKKVRDVCKVLRAKNLDDVSKVVIYIGGNDVAGRDCDLNEVSKDLQEIIHHLQQLNCSVYLCSAAPRYDTNVTELNTRLATICDETDATLINIHDAFIYRNGQPVMTHYHHDRIHLNLSGTQTLVRTINNSTLIVKRRDVQRQTPFNIHQTDDNGYTPVWRGQPRRHLYNQRQRCEKCGLLNHETKNCRRNW